MLRIDREYMQISDTAYLIMMDRLILKVETDCDYET